MSLLEKEEKQMENTIKILHKMYFENKNRVDG
jgi:hypothetical protein